MLACLGTVARTSSNIATGNAMDACGGSGKAVIVLAGSFLSGGYLNAAAAQPFRKVAFGVAQGLG